MKTDQEAKLKVQRDAKLQTEQDKIEDKTTCKAESGARDEVESRDQNSRPRDFILKLTYFTTSDFILKLTYIHIRIVRASNGSK